MVADLNSKQLPRKQFEFLRDIMNGYALVYERHKGYLVDKPDISSWRTRGVQAKERVSRPSNLGKSKVKTKRSGKGISAKKIKQAASMASTKRKSGKDLLAALVKKLKSGN